MNLSSRLKAVVIEKTTEYRRFKQLEDLTSVQADTWKSWYHGRQRPTAEMIEEAGKNWPEYAFWLTTGISDPDYGHIAPGTAGFPVRSERKENSATLFARWLALKSTALEAARVYLDRAGMEEIEEYDELARVIAQMSPEDGEAPIDLTAYWAARKLCRNAESLRRAEILLVTDMPKLSYEATEPLLELVEDILKKVEGPSKAKLAAILNKERILVRRNNALEQAKNLDETMQALKDHNPYT
ncbi:hypothetical protein [Janthinobacterium sp. SUN206]|uniref:hypothetical protein n=1 Tax=Janthinobacterium sp. SUN206 TaxID=3014787 RepID=UPI0027134212|nr:hypothetical protein [Janthinobacterium sp. SUN206]MDO8067907.1 hypothetical protein [Janthinobacterium sp. SUN206]